MTIFGYNSVFSIQDYVPILNTGDGKYYHIYSAIAADSGFLSDVSYMYNYNGTTSRGASVSIHIYNTAGTSSIKSYNFSTVEDDGPAWRLTSATHDFVAEPAVVKGTRYRIVFSGGTSDFDNSAYEMRYRYDEVGSINNHYAVQFDNDPVFTGSYTNIRRMSFYVTLDYNGPELKVEDETPGKVEGIDWKDLSDVY